MTIKGRFKIDVYCCTVHLIISDNIQRSQSYYYKKFGYKEEIVPIEGTVLYNNVSNYYIIFDKESLSVNVINHEKSHLTELILKQRDIKPTHETRAYLDGFISNKIDLFFKKRKLKIKNS